MKEQITSYIVNQLSHAESENDIIYSVCEKTGLGWAKAQALVEQVRNDHQAEIEARQTPLKILLSFVLYILGMALIAGPILYLWSMLGVSRMLLAFISSRSSADAEIALRLFGSRCLLLGWFELPSLLFTVLVGIGIIQANIRSMGGTWAALFRSWKIM